MVCLLLHGTGCFFVVVVVVPVVVMDNLKVSKHTILLSSSSIPVTPFAICEPLLVKITLSYVYKQSKRRSITRSMCHEKVSIPLPPSLSQLLACWF